LGQWSLRSVLASISLMRVSYIDQTRGIERCKVSQ